MNNIRQVSQSVAECFYHTDLCISKITVSLSKNLYSIETFVINFFENYSLTFFSIIYLFSAGTLFLHI